MNNPVDIEKLLVWLRRHAKGEPGMVELSHINVGGHGTAIDRWPVAETDGEDELARIATDIHRAACDDADGQQLAHGPQQYLVNYFAADDVRTAASRLPFTVLPARQANLGPPGEGISSEPPTQSGFVAMVMRHADSAHQRSWSIAGHALAIIERYTGQIAQENARLRDANFELTKGYEELLTQHHVRELAAQTALHERAEKTLLYGRLSELAPPIAAFLVSKMAGAGATTTQAPALALGPGASPPSAPRAAALHGSPTASDGELQIDADAETQTFMASLTPEQAQAFASIAHRYAAPTASHESRLPEPHAATIPPVDVATQARALFESLNPEQFVALQRVLTTEQTIAFSALSTSLNSGASDLLGVQLRGLLDSLSREQLIAIRNALSAEQTELLVRLWQSLPSAGEAPS